MSKNLGMNAETGANKLTGRDARLQHTVIVKAVKRNWLWLSVYGVITIGGVVTSYLIPGGLPSVAVTIFVDVLTYIVGWHMVHEVITITNEIR
jgi:hypothetical protein